MRSNLQSIYILLLVFLPVFAKAQQQSFHLNINYSPSLADKSARNTATYTKDEISEEIAEVINAN